MSAYVFYTSIAGPQYSQEKDWNTAWDTAGQLIKVYEHSIVFVYDQADSSWAIFRRGLRGGLSYSEGMDEDEVPKVYRLLLALEI